MSDKNVELDVFVRKVLACMKEQRRSVEEIHEEYLRLHPPGFFRRQLFNPVNKGMIEVALRELVVLELLTKEITRFHGDRALRNDIFVYRLTNKGRSSLLPRKK